VLVRVTRSEHASPQADYARRRAQLADWIIPPDEWEQLYARIAAAPGLKQKRLGDSQRRRTLFSVFAWAAATSGDLHLAPLVRATPRGDLLRLDIAQARYRALALPGQFPAVLASAAENYGATLGASADLPATALARLCRAQG
jgi:hypothetical protein